MRLFSRGHEEEFRIVRWLRAMDIQVRDYAQRLMWKAAEDIYTNLDWGQDCERDGWLDVSQDAAHIQRAARRNRGPQQWGFDKGHFKGSADGMVCGPLLPDGWGLLECKTSNDKGFKRLQASTLLKAKPEHYIQMQLYMRQLDLPWALYMVVNKNDDEIYTEIVRLKSEVADFHIDRAHKIIAADTAPPRITEDASWWQCKFCDFREICFYDAVPAESCRTCVFSRAARHGVWHCNHWDSDLPADYDFTPCSDWKQIP